MRIHLPMQEMQGRFPGEGNDNPFQYSSLENSMDTGAWWAMVLGVTESQTQLKQLSMLTGMGKLL